MSWIVKDIVEYINMGETNYGLSFDKIVARLEQSVRPVMQDWSKELANEFASTQVKFQVTRSDNHPRSIHKHFFSIYITCGKKGATKFPDHGDMMLSVSLSQQDDLSNPMLSAEIGMLVDEESGGDWGFQHIANLFSNKQEVDEDVFEVLGSSLPQLYQELRNTLGKSGNAQ